MAAFVDRRFRSEHLSRPYPFSLYLRSIRFDQKSIRFDQNQPKYFHLCYICGIKYSVKNKTVEYAAEMLKLIVKILAYVLNIF